MKLTLIAFLFVGIFFAISCQEGAFYEKNESIIDRSWSYSDIKKFTVHHAKLNQKYALFVNLRHSSDYDYSNIFMRIYQEGPSLRDTIRFEVKLAELDGRWTGRKAGDVLEHQVLINDNYTFPDTGTYTLTLEQNMRENPLLHISDVGIKLIIK